MIKQIVDAVTIPVMAKVRIGHFVEAQVCNGSSDYVAARGTQYAVRTNRSCKPLASTTSMSRRS